MPTTAKPRRPRTAKATAAAKRSNRRTRDTPTIARVDASRLAEGVVSIFVDDVLTKNERHRLVVVNLGGKKRRAATKESDLAVAFKDAMRTAAEAAGFIHGANTINAGTWALEVLAVWPTQRHLDDGTHTANGDSDAPLSMVKDALQHAGIIDNDMRIVTDRTLSHYAGPKQRWTVARLTRVDPGAHMDAVAELIRLGPCA